MNTKNHPTGDLPLSISRIFVATDFSEQASKALEWARSFADALGAKLVLLHVIDIPKVTSQCDLRHCCVVRQTDRRVFRVRRARLTFSKISEARAVQIKGLGLSL